MQALFLHVRGGVNWRGQTTGGFSKVDVHEGFKLFCVFKERVHFDLCGLSNGPLWCKMVTALRKLPER